MNIDRLFCGTCPGCGQYRGSLWFDRDTKQIVEPCIKCRRERRGPPSLAVGTAVAEVTRKDHGGKLVLDTRQPDEAACVIDISRCPTLISIAHKR